MPMLQSNTNDAAPLMNLLVSNPYHPTNQSYHATPPNLPVTTSLTSSAATAPATAAPSNELSSAYMSSTTPLLPPLPSTN